MKKAKLMLGDNIELLKKLPDNSVDSVVTDGPYALTPSKGAKAGFMGKLWDYQVPSIEFWSEVFRVLKPGGHILSFGGTRTYHRMVVNMEDAGFEIRDQIMWLYGSGFPKSHNIGKSVDKRGGESVGWFGEWLVEWRKKKNIPQSKIAELFPSKTGGLTGCVSNWELGNNLPTNEQFNLICKTFDLPFNSIEQAEREFIGTKKSGIGKAFGDGVWNTGEYGDADVVDITKGQSNWEGWGSALKPANEPICLARKPLSEKSIAENVLKWGTGGINVDGCRVGNEVVKTSGNNGLGSNGIYCDTYKGCDDSEDREGRFPANIILDEIAAEMLDEQSGIVSQGHWSKGSTKGFGEFGGGSSSYEGVGPKDKTKSGASRFFYQAKVSKAERNMGLDEFEEKKKDFETTTRTNKETADKFGCERKGTAKNTHPTVKPVALMTYLCRLITPPNGIVLDPFMGSGSTGISALLEGFRFCGMEQDKSYFDIASARIENYEEYRKFIKK